MSASDDHGHAPPVPEIPHLAPDSPHAPPAVHTSARDEFSRALIALIVVTTFLGALAAVLHSYSMSRANHAGLEAQAYGAKMAEESLRRQEDGHARLEWAARAGLTRTQVINVEHRKILRELRRLPAAASGPEDLEGEVARLRALAAHLDRVSGIAPDSPEAPGRDPTFPDRFLVKKIKTVHARARLLAMQDAFNELNAAWRIRAGWYTACLTAYAVAVYLFSLALMTTPSGGIAPPWRWSPAGGPAWPWRRPLSGEDDAPPRRVRPPAALLFAALGLALVVVATVGAAYGAATSPREKTARAVAEQAAERYADGVEAAALASTPGEYEQAVRHLRHALEYRPNLVHAHAELASALFLQGSPQAAERFVSMTDPAALQQARQAAEEARRRGLRRAALLVSLGWNTFLAALEAREPARRQLAEESVALTREAAHRDPDESITYSNLGLAMLLLGRETDSDRYYEDAVRRARYARAGSTVPRTASDLRDRIVSDLTDLELLRAFAPHLSEAIDARKGWLVGKAWPGPAGPYGSLDRRLPDLRIAVTSTAARWEARVTPLNPRNDVVVAVWYRHREYRPGVWVWHALPSLSGPVGVAADGTLQRTRSYAPSPYRCLEGGRYRLELYVNGRPAGSAEAEARLPALDHHEFPDLALRMCYPLEWLPSPHALRGVVEGFVAADRSAGAHLFRFRDPGGAAPARATADAFTGWALDRLRLGTGRIATAVEGAPFLGTGLQLVYTRHATYAHAGGRARVGVGISTLGTVVVGVVHGRGEFIDTPLARGVFESFR
jgi:tetratricopeptide (TPR) repeat protein